MSSPSCFPSFHPLNPLVPLTPHIPPIPPAPPILHLSLIPSIPLNVNHQQQFRKLRINSYPLFPVPSLPCRHSPLLSLLLTFPLSFPSSVHFILHSFLSQKILTEILASMREASTTALEVVNELLAFEKIAAGMYTIEPLPTALLAFVRHCMRQHLLPALAKVSFSERV